MGRFIAGCISALLLVAGGLFWWQGHGGQGEAVVAAKPQAAAAPVPEALPVGDPDAVGRAPPVPAATARTREQKRFDRYDRDRDNILTRAEMLGPRVKDFRKLDKDGNNLLSFEEWSARTIDRFDGADANHDGRLTRAEFATTAPVRKAAAKCNCAKAEGAD